MILGIKIMRQGERIQLSQPHYVDKILKWFSTLDKVPISNPMKLGMKFAKHTGSSLKYLKVIGSLMYAMTCIAPDIAFAVGKLSRFTSNLIPHHWIAITRVLRYLLHTLDYGITYNGEPPILEGYFDASWITNEEGNCSTSFKVFI